MTDAQSTNPEAINPSGENQAGKLPEPSADSLSAGNAAFEQHFEENPKKGRGRPPIHGRYIGQRKSRSKGTGQIPLGQMGNGTRPILLEEAQPDPVVPGCEDIAPAFNEEVNRKFAGIILSVLVRVSNSIKRRRIIKETENPDLAEFVTARKTISAEPREAIETGLVECARKYQVDLSKTPEGMVILGLIVWQSEDSANTTALISEYHRLRPQNQNQ